MSWQSWIKALVELFAPLVLKWLQDLFKQLLDKPDSISIDPALAVHDTFAAARAEMGVVWPWQWWKLRQLARAERVALRYAGELVAAAKGEGHVPVMTGREYDSITSA